MTCGGAGQSFRECLRKYLLDSSAALCPGVSVFFSNTVAKPLQLKYLHSIGKQLTMCSGFTAGHPPYPRRIGVRCWSPSVKVRLANLLVRWKVGEHNNCPRQRRN